MKKNHLTITKTIFRNYKNSPENRVSVKLQAPFGKLWKPTGVYSYLDEASAQASYNF